MTTRYLVTGVAGAVGYAIASEILRNGDTVIGIDILNSETKPREERVLSVQALQREGKQRFRFAECDIVESKALLALVRKERPDKVIHAAALVRDRASIYEATDYCRVNVEGTANLLDAIREVGGVKNMVFISSRSAVGEINGVMTEDTPMAPVNAYGASKGGAEQILRAHFHNFGAPNITVLRLNPQICDRTDMAGRRFLTAIHNGDTMMKYGDGKAIRDWLHPSDTVDAVLRAADYSQGYNVFLIGTGKATSLNEFIDAVESTVGKKAIIEHKPTPVGDAIYGGTADYSKIRAAIGWQPQRTLKDGLKDLYAHLRLRDVL